MSIMAPIALLPIPGRRDPPSQNFFLANREFLLALWGARVRGGGVINIGPVEPFETGPVIKGYPHPKPTNTIELIVA